MLVDDPDRFGDVAALGLDETLRCRLGPWRHQRWTTQIVDVGAGQLLDVVEGRTAIGPIHWLAERPQHWRDGVEWATLDLSGPYRKVFDTMLPAAVPGCYRLPEAHEITAGHIKRLGLSDWTVTSERGEADGETTCTYFYLDARTQRVVLIPLEGIAPPADAPYVVLAERPNTITTESCLTIEEAVQATLQEATNLGLNPGEPHLIIHRVLDNAASCARADVNVGGRIEVTVRGPSS